MRVRRKLIEDALLVTLNSHRGHIVECVNFMDFWDRNYVDDRDDHPSTVRLQFWPSPDAGMNEEYGNDEQREYLQDVAFYIDTLTIQGLEHEITQAESRRMSREEHRERVRRARGILIDIIGPRDRHLGGYLFPESDIRNPDKKFTEDDIKAAIKHNEEN